MDRSIKVLKLPHKESSGFWSDQKHRTTQVLLRFFSSLVYCLFLLFLTALSIQIYTFVKPELENMLANQIPDPGQNLILVFLFVFGLFYATLEMLISIYGVYKNWRSNVKTTVFTIVFVGIELLFMGVNLYLNLVLNLVAAAICLILAVLWVERLPLANEK